MTTSEAEALVDHYTSGGCLAFAFALHWMCGWPVAAVSERGGDDHLHFAARGPDGMAWDALGPRTFEAAAADYAETPCWEDVDALRFVATDGDMDETVITRACTDVEALLGPALAPHIARRPQAIPDRM